MKLKIKTKKSLFVIISLILTVAVIQAVPQSSGLFNRADAAGNSDIGLDDVSYYEYDGRFVKGVEPETDGAAFRSQFVVDVTVKDAKGAEITSGFVGTGATVSSVKGTATVIVSGDTDGTGKIDSTDYILVKRHILKLSALSGAYLLAADTDGNTVIDSTDYILVKRTILGMGKKTQTLKFNPTDANGNYRRIDDGKIYETSLGEYSRLYAEAKKETSVDKRFVLFAKAEAELLDSAVMIPTTSKGGAYMLSRIAPHTVPYVQWGSDDARLKGMIITSDGFITKAEREELLSQWAKAVKGEGSYDPASYLKAKGHGLSSTYSALLSTAPVTLDWLSTSSEADTGILVNTVDGLVEYDNLNRLNPALAESWTVSDDGLTYTFRIRKNVKWYTSEGKAYASLTAKDFVAGFRHMLDARGGLEWLVDDVISGAYNYYAEGGSWDDVGYKATDDYTLRVTLIRPTSYFLTMLTYSCFLPMCESFYLSKGGVYGVTEFEEASADTTKYTYGLNTDVGSQVYCGSHRITKFSADSEIILTKNPGYYRANDVTISKISFVNNSDKGYAEIYRETVNGLYSSVALNESVGTLDMAKKDGNFDKCAYISEISSVTFFGGLNLDRGTFALENGNAASNKTDQQKIDTLKALNCRQFRQAVQYAFDKASYNAESNGEELKLANLRNMYTHPEFVSLSADTTVDGKTFKKGTFYGEIVQYYLEQLGSPVLVSDGVNGWYHPEEAKKALEGAKKELLSQGVSFPVYIDVVFLSNDDVNAAQAKAYKRSVENALGKENVTINLVEATTREDFYACGYRASNGEAGNFDMFYGSGWGPDYGDPSTYLETFLGNGAGYMTKVIGLF